MVAPTCGHGRAYGQDSLVEKVEEEGFLSSQRLVTLAQALLRYLQISLLGLVPVKLAFVATPQVFILGLSRYTIPGYQSAAARRTCLVGPQPRSLCMLILSSKFAHDGMHASCRSGTARAVGGVGGGEGGKGNRGKNERRQLDTGREMAAGALYIDLAHDEEYKALFRLLLNRGVLVRSGELR